MTSTNEVEVEMKKYHARFQLREIIKDHELHRQATHGDDFDVTQTLNRAVITLSHRIFKSRGRRGHNIRQKIRSELHWFIKNEFRKYDKEWVIKSPNGGIIKSSSLPIRIKFFLSGLFGWWRK